MNSKRNGIAALLLLLIAAVFVLSGGRVFGVSALLELFIGAAFILLYMAKRAVFALVVGMASLFLAAVSVLGSRVSGGSTVAVVFSLLFFSLCAVFFVLYFDKNKRGLLLPASFLLWLGLHTLAGVWKLPLIHNHFFQSLTFCAAMSLLTAYGLGRGGVRKWALYVGSVLLVGSVLSIFGFGGIFGAIKALIGLAVVLAIVALVVRAIKK